MNGEKLSSIETKDEFLEISDQIAQSDVTVYERLNPTNTKAAKEEFLANPDMVRPNYEQGGLDGDEIGANLNRILDVEDELKTADLPDGRRRLLEYLAEDVRKKNDFLAANLVYNSATEPAMKQAAAEHHREANEALYGRPDEDTFYTLLKEKIDSIDYDSLSNEDKKVYDDLMSEIGPIPETTSERFKPKQETVEQFAELVNYFFDGFLKHIPQDKESFSSEDMVGMINEILDEEFQDEDIPYRAEIKPSASNASANHEDRRIYFPEGKSYTPARAKALIVHELGTHVMRAIPYTGHDVAAFSTGLPNNEEFDEGVAKAVEQAINGKYEDSGIDHYINIGLANFKGKNFRQVYDIQCKLKQLTGSKTDTVFNAVQRCFRGTGELPNNKDLAYYNGANRVWKYIEDHLDDPELFDHLFLTGKLDYQDDAQEAISYEVRTKGI